MVKSMTGYGRSEAILGDKRVAVEIKSLNHRYLEVSLRLPSAFSAMELELKKKINAQISRGKIEVLIRQDAIIASEEGRSLDLNVPLLRNYYSLLCRIKEELKLSEEINLSHVTACKDIFVFHEEAIDEISQRVAALVDEAVALLTVMRTKEGDTLSRDLRERIAAVELLIEAIQIKTPHVLNAYQKRLTERIKELTGDMDIDASRLMQEVAILAEKSDIAEEIVRFHSHIDQFREMLTSEEAVGRKLDFLIQEMGREVNTIGSKSNDREISRGVIELKNELARIREQVQNLE